MIDNLIGGLILSFLVFLIVHFYLKNKKEGKDNYDGLNDGSGGQQWVQGQERNFVRFVAKTGEQCIG